MLTTEQAIEALKAGQTVLMTVGKTEEDPVLRVWNDDGLVMSVAVSGWSAGVVEAVCDIGSEFLTTYYLKDREKLEIVDAIPAQTGGWEL